MTHIIVEIEDGLVSRVWSTDKDITVDILNRDLPENNEEEEAEILEENAKLDCEIRDSRMVDIL